VWYVAGSALSSRRPCTIFAIGRARRVAKCDAHDYFALKARVLSAIGCNACMCGYSRGQLREQRDFACFARTGVLASAA